MSVEQIPQEELIAARRKVCRRIAASLAMAETDTGIPDIAVRLGRSETTIRIWFQQLFDGTMKSLDHVSDLAWSMGCVWDFSVKCIETHRPQLADRPEEGDGK